MRRGLAAFRAAAGVTLRGFLAGGEFAACLALVAFSLLAAALLESASPGQGERLAADLGWGAAGLFGWFLAVAHGSGLRGGGGVAHAAALARPVSPALLFGARFVGLLGGLAVYSALAGALIAARLGLDAAPAVMAAGWFLLLRLVVVLALSVAFHAAVRPPVAAVLAAACASAGWFSGSLPGAEAGDAIRRLAAVARWLLPDLASLDPVLGPLGAMEAGAALFGATAYAALYAGAVLVGPLFAFPWLVRRSGRWSG